MLIQSSSILRPLNKKKNVILGIEDANGRWRDKVDDTTKAIKNSFNEIFYSQSPSEDVLHAIIECVEELIDKI